jgi:hypothetical protein
MVVASGLTKLWHVQSETSGSRADPDIFVMRNGYLVITLSGNTFPCQAAPTLQLFWSLLKLLWGEGKMILIQKYKTSFHLKDPVCFYRL